MEILQRRAKRRAAALLQIMMCFSLNYLATLPNAGRNLHSAGSGLASLWVSFATSTAKVNANSSMNGWVCPCQPKIRRNPAKTLTERQAPAPASRQRIARSRLKSSRSAFKYLPVKKKIVIRGRYLKAERDDF